MSTHIPEPYRPENLKATASAARRLSLAGAWVSIGILGFVVGLESILPVSRGAAVRDGIGLALITLGSWAVFAVANALVRRFPASGAAFGAILALMIGFGGIAFIVNFVLDVVLAPGVLPLAVPAALVVSIVVPGVYVAFAARAIQNPSTRSIVGDGVV